MRNIDRQARRRFGIPEIVLMEHAGKAVASEAYRQLKRRGTQSGLALVLSGGGANGGDGLVAARHLVNWGVPVSVWLLSAATKLKGAYGTNLTILRRLGVPVVTIASMESFRQFSRRIRPGLIVDALLGTGVSGKIREPIRSAILWIRRQTCPVISVDLPSGLSSDEGQVRDVAVKATTTVACGFPKLASLKGKGRELSGQVKVADISLPRALRA